MAALPHIRAGEPLSDIARRLGVSRQAVHQWAEQYRQGGTVGLRRKTRPGRRPKLPPHHLAQLARLLGRGARASGFATDQWTSQRVADLIWKRFRVRYDRAYVCRLLHRFGWNWQRPAARVRAKAAIPRWVRPTSARLKRTPRI